MYRFASVRKITLLLCAFAVFGGTPLLAQDAVPQLAAAAAIEPPAAQLPLSLGARDLAVATVPLPVPKARRPKALMPLYASFASLQVLDVHSTTRALDRGAVEMNPLMKGIAGSPAGLLAIKAGATTGVVYAGERLWKRNKAAAVIFMIAANTAMGWVVQHNYRAVK
jgi:hypothetical protein